MSLLDTLRSGIKIANNITRPLQTVVMYSRKVSIDSYGPIYATSVPLHAVLDYKTSQGTTVNGTVVTAQSSMTLIDVAEIVNATGGNGIGNDDTFTLPDGKVVVIKTGSLKGFVDPGTGQPVATEVMLG